MLAPFSGFLGNGQNDPPDSASATKLLHSLLSVSELFMLAESIKKSIMRIIRSTF